MAKSLATMAGRLVRRSSAPIVPNMSAHGGSHWGFGTPRVSRAPAGATQRRPNSGTGDLTLGIQGLGSGRCLPRRLQPRDEHTAGWRPSKAAAHQIAGDRARRRFSFWTDFDFRFAPFLCVPSSREGPASMMSRIPDDTYRSLGLSIVLELLPRARFVFQRRPARGFGFVFGFGFGFGFGGCQGFRTPALRAGYWKMLSHV